MSTTATQGPHAASSVAVVRSWRFPRFAFLTALVALVGLLVFMYPNIAGWFAQYNQSLIISSVGTSLKQESPTRLEAEILKARSYNEALVGGALVAPNSNLPTSDGAASSDLDYEGLLRADADGTMARLRVPSINVDLPIFHGTADETLERGVGHLQGTSLPVGGVSQHSVLTAHRGLANAEMFNHLDRVEIGDTFTVEVFGEVLTYRVVSTQVVQPDETQTLTPQLGKDLMTLVTCTPLGINSHRILVTGERIIPTPIGDLERAGANPDVPGFPWWAVWLGGGILIASAYVWRMGRVEEVVPT
ncbi:class C sortase [Leucobacter sp. W1478]|uniref:class C sortase n=1 Tax=Leucobacter sp. W1478 TaxID=3439065 RepID=UPI003F3AAA00